MQLLCEHLSLLRSVPTERLRLAIVTVFSETYGHSRSAIELAICLLFSVMKLQKWVQNPFLRWRRHNHNRQWESLYRLPKNP